jgi:hypothetical protein
MKSYFYYLWLTTYMLNQIFASTTTNVAFLSGRQQLTTTPPRIAACIF